jgi:magnesium transporter
MISTYRWSESGVESVGSELADLAPGRWVWVDVVGEPPETLRAIGEHYGLDPSSIEESFSTSNLPLVEEHLNEVFIVLHGLTTGTGGRLSTPEIHLFIGVGFLITIRDGERASIELIKDRIAEEGDIPVSSPAGLLAFLAHSSGRQYAPLIQELERQVDSLEELSIQGDPQAVVEIHALRRDVIFLRRALAPQFDVYDDLSESTHPAIDDEARKLFARVANQHRRSLESLEAGRALLGSVLETYRGAVADQTNEIMRVLTVFSAILLPLTLIAGIWGMNFARIPGSDEPRGFWLLLGLMLLLAAGVWIYFTRRGFIGAPRLRELPKAVGIGLFTIGTAPIRVVADGIRQLGRIEDDA